jgi:hypothetical protein
MTAVFRLSCCVFLSLLACAASVCAQSSPEPTAAPRKVRINFLPPPLEGKISLGIYNSQRELVRILHREAEIKDFRIGADALSTTWDGKDEANADLPAGKYNAHGYVVGDVKIESVGPTTTESGVAPEKITLKLISNPLTPGRKSSVDIAAGFDEDASYLQSGDGLPLLTVDETPDLMNVFITQRADKSLDFFQNDGDTVDQFHITGAEKMMAFDCGEFELK